VPTYQYACTVCGHQLEAVQSFTDAPLTECPECAGRLRKLFSSVGIVFKGSGFYRNDSRSDSSAAKDAAPAKDGAAPAKEPVSSGTSSGDGASKTSTSGDSTSTAAPAKSSSPASAAAA
jgi:putative FmdB family regulatory protein